MHPLMGWLLGSLVAVGGTAQASAGQPEPTPEVAWARGIAEDFWRAAQGGHQEVAAGLMSPELVRAAVAGTYLMPSKTLPAEYFLQEWFHRNARCGPEVKATFDVAHLAPDRTEVVFRGRLSGVIKHQAPVALEVPVASDFTMRVARESAGGKWSIRYLLVTDRAVRE